MQLFRHISSAIRRLFRGTGSDGRTAQSSALAEEFVRRRDTFIVFVKQTSLSDDLKSRLITTAMSCSRWDDLQKRVEDLINYILDLWDIGGEDYDEAASVITRIRESAREGHS